MTGDGPAEEVLTALADPTRRRILDLLAARGEATATILAAELPVTRQGVVKHLAALDRAGLVAGQRRGREVRYRVRPERLSSTARWMDQVAARWDARLSAIKRIAEDGAWPARDQRPAECDRGRQEFPKKSLQR
jgi:DNA-binding transcriptional ArsR family regulator